MKDITTDSSFPDEGGDEGETGFSVGDAESIGLPGSQPDEESVLHGNGDDTEDRLTDLENRLNSRPLPAPLPFVFPVQVGTGNTFQELVPKAGTLTTGGTRNYTGDSSSGAGLISLAAGQGIAVESRESAVVRFILVSGSGSSGSYSSITGINSALSSVEWIYNISPAVNGINTARNGLEIGGAIAGTPGSLGIDVGSDGSVTGTSCFIQPLGVVPFVPIITVGSTNYFALTNSAG